MKPQLQVCQDFIQGDGFVIKVSHNPVVDLTGATFELSMKKREEGNLVLNEVYAVPVTEPEAANALLGIVNIPVPAASTALVGPGEYYASLKRTLAGGEVKTLLRTGKDNARKVIVYRNLKNS